MPFLNSNFFRNIQGVTLWLSNGLFCGQKWRANMYFRKFCLQISSLISKELAHTLLSEPFRPREEVFPKMGSVEFSVTSYTIVFYPYKRTELLIFREIVFVAQNPLNISIPTFKIFIFILMFDWIGARKYGLLGIIRQYWLLRSPVGEEWADNISKLLERSSMNSDRIDQYLRWKISKC